MVTDGDEILAILLPASQIPEGLSFLTDQTSFLQVGTWGYDSGKMLPPHIHNPGLKREIDRTQEVVHVVRGRIRARVYSEDEGEVDSLELGQGDTLVLLGGGHGYEILENGTRVLEVKNGPYAGPDLDRHRIRVESST